MAVPPDPARTGMSRDLEGADPIFILGILPRSGTNFLWDLLLLHPHVARARSPIDEDLFLDRSDHLEAFVRSVHRSWDPIWGAFDDALMGDFRASLGDGLLSFLWVDRARRLVTKSPSVERLDRFFTFFPDARLLILVRDGRSVVHSCMTTFGWSLDRAARMWANGARRIERFDSSPDARKDRYRIVRYEDLVDDLEPTLSAVLEFLGLDAALYDLGAAADLPVRGSSFYHGADRTSVHWDPVEKSADFEPKGQWRAWTPDMHERFEWIAGAEMRQLGYGSVAGPISGRRRVARHRALDAAWTIRGAGSRFFHGAVGATSSIRPLRELLRAVRAGR